jgi:hypothetical protein
MGNNHSQSTSLSLSVTNDILQAANSTCSISCNQSQDGNTIIIDGSTTGDISFSQTCSIVGSNCTIKAYLDANLDTVLEAMAEQTSVSAAGFPGIGFNSDDQSVSIQENVRNSITQLINNNCQISSNQSFKNNYVYVTGSSTGDLTFAQSSEITNSDCILDTIAKAVASTKENAKVKQTSVDIGPLALIGIVFGAIIMIIVLIFVFTIATKVMGGLGSTISNTIESNRIRSGGYDRYNGYNRYSG